MANENLNKPTSRLSDAAGSLARSVEDNVRDGAGAVAEAARETGHEAKVRFEDVVTSNPLMSMGIAAGIGYLLGAVLRR